MSNVTSATMNVCKALELNWESNRKLEAAEVLYAAGQSFEQEAEKKEQEAIELRTELIERLRDVAHDFANMSEQDIFTVLLRTYLD